MNQPIYEKIALFGLTRSVLVSESDITGNTDVQQSRWKSKHVFMNALPGPKVSKQLKSLSFAGK